MRHAMAMVTHSVIRVGALWAVAAIVGATPAIGTETSLQMSSEPGDYIGAEQEYFYDQNSGTFSASVNYDQGVSVSFHTPYYEHWWYLDFAAADGAALVPGFYTGAVRFPFQGAGQPGLSVYGDGRGCNTLTGAFEVKQLTIDASGAVTAFWAVFEQHCEGGEPALTGDIRFGADIVVAVKAPFSRKAPRGKRLTFDVTATEVHGHPVGLSAEGLPDGATFLDHGNNVGTFEWTPPTDAPLGPVTVRFHGDNGLGQTDTATTTLQVRGQTRLFMTSDPGDPLGGGRTYLYSETSGFFQSSQNYANGVSVSFHTPDSYEWWYLDFAAPDRAPLAVGSYPNARRFPFQGPGEAGLSVVGNGAGCNTLTGSFDIKQLTRHSDGSIMSFWATFEQHCEGAAPALRGDVRINADVPFTNNPPTADAGPDLSGLECASLAGTPASLNGTASSDPDGDPLTFMWVAPGIVFDDPASPTPSAEFPLGTTIVTLTVSDGQDSATDTVNVTVVDTTPPEISSTFDPAALWPPNHRMIPVTATVVATDACSVPAVRLESVSSSEPDDAPGWGDGETVGDIQQADIGSADFGFELRAEREGAGNGRTYTARYSATDASGNSAAAEGHVDVPHDRSGKTDPIEQTVDNDGQGTSLSWSGVPGALRYNVIRGDLADVRETAGSIDLGSVVCITAGAALGTNHVHADSAIPPEGHVYFYLVEYDDGARSSYGAESARKPRVVGAHDCE